MVEFVSRGLRFFSRLFEMFQEGCDIFRGGVKGVNPPPKFSDFFLKSEGKEIYIKKRKGVLGGGGGWVISSHILGVDIFRVGLRYFQGG